MAIQAISKWGNQALATPSLAVKDFAARELAILISDMQETMQAKNGVGIAAPQIGCNKRVILFGFDKNERYPNEKPIALTVIINPEIEALSAEMIEAWEGCLSIPGLRGLVPRYKKIRYRGYDIHGQLISGMAEGFHARVLQHECDHIDGILFPERLHDMRCFGFEDELREIIWPKQT